MYTSKAHRWPFVSVGQIKLIVRWLRNDKALHVSTDSGDSNTNKIIYITLLRDRLQIKVLRATNTAHVWPRHNRICATRLGYFTHVPHIGQRRTAWRQRSFDTHTQRRRHPRSTTISMFSFISSSKLICSATTYNIVMFFKHATQAANVRLTKLLQSINAKLTQTFANITMICVHERQRLHIFHCMSID